MDDTVIEDIEFNVGDDISSETQAFAAITHFPSPLASQQVKRSDEEKINFIASRYREIMEVLGLDLTDDSIARTPERIGKMYVKEIFSGLDSENFPSITFMKNPHQGRDSSHFIFVQVALTSFCEHHFVPFHGTAHVAYRPNKKIIGLSKIHRVVKYFAKRPQLQERLGAQIADSLSILLDTPDVAVSIQAKHYCVVARGVEDENSYTVTHHFQGEFNTNTTLRDEFFASIKMGE